MVNQHFGYGEECTWKTKLCVIDMDELGERFSTTTMFGKLANIGDDISDEFLQER